MNTVAITVGVTEEMADSVHSLYPRNKGYYDWKKESHQERTQSMEEVKFSNRSSSEKDTMQEYAEHREQNNYILAGES